MNGKPPSKLSLDGMNGLAFGLTNAPRTFMHESCLREYLGKHIFFFFLYILIIFNLFKDFACGTC